MPTTTPKGGTSRFTAVAHHGQLADARVLVHDAVAGDEGPVPDVDVPGDQRLFFETRFQGQRHPHYGRFLRLQPDRLVKLPRERHDSAWPMALEHLDWRMASGA